jgi:hypothetical protein
MAWTEIDRRVVDLAESQHGIVGHQQLVSVGAQPALIHRRLTAGQWQSLAQGVYRVPGHERTWRQSLIAAVLAAGPGAVASHRSAAALWKLPGFDGGVPEVLRPRHTDHRCALGRVHESAVIRPAHVTVVDAIPVTGPARTVFDLAGVVHPKRTARALDKCLSDGLADMASFYALLDELKERGRRGIALMRELLAKRGPNYVPPSSELEHRLLDVLVEAGLPEPQRQVWAGGSHVGGRVDFAYCDRGVLIEADSRLHHMSGRTSRTTAAATTGSWPPAGGCSALPGSR